jgi:hypothetical protein
MEGLYKFDFYRRVPRELTKPTAIGAIVSLVCATVIALLMCFELVSYLSPPLKSEMFVAPEDPATAGGRLRANVDMTFHRLPCFALSLDVVDALGRHEIGIGGSLTKTRVSPAGAPLGAFTADMYQRQDQLEAQGTEGCRVHGWVPLARVPGNFHVSNHGLESYTAKHLARHGRMDVGHTIHAMWFGERADLSHGRDGEVHPLNGVVARGPAGEHYEYHLDVVPTVYGSGRAEVQAYQFAASRHSQQQGMQQVAPAAVFRYQLSPITVRLTREGRSFLHLCTYLCGVVGGVYTVSMILSRVFYRAAAQYRRKVLGKSE